MPKRRATHRQAGIAFSIQQSCPFTDLGPALCQAFTRSNSPPKFVGFALPDGCSSQKCPIVLGLKVRTSNCSFFGGTGHDPWYAPTKNCPVSNWLLFPTSANLLTPSQSCHVGLWSIWLWVKNAPNGTLVNGSKTCGPLVV